MENDDIPALENAEDKESDDNEQDDDYDDDDDYEDVNCAGEPHVKENVTCLFCTEKFPSVPTALEHIKQIHNIDFAQLKVNFKMDQYSFIKLINCIRADDIISDQLKSASQPFWEDEKYLKPKRYEPWLTFDYDQIELPENVETEEVDVTTSNNRNFNYYVSRLENIIKEQSHQLRLVSDDITTMRKSFKRLMTEKDTPDCSASKRYTALSFDSFNREQTYFDSYSHYGIHYDMLADSVRTEAFRDAICKNSELISGKDVLDVGCGTAILSIFAAKAGAKNVVGIDNSLIIFDAMDIVRNNNIENVHLLKGRLEHTELPQERYDVIISEWMGYFLLFEGMLDTVIYARDRHLKPDGILMPNRCCLQIAGYGNDVSYKEHIDFWRNAYGVDMSCIIDKVIQEPAVHTVDANYILTESNCIANIDVMKADMNYADFQHNFELKCTKAGVLSAIVGYFDVFFDLPSPITLTTSPNAPSTHWKQVVFYLKHPHAVQANDLIKGRIKCRRNVSNARSLVIDIEVFDNNHSYYLD